MMFFIAVLALRFLIKLRFPNDVQISVFSSTDPVICMEIEKNGQEGIVEKNLH